MNIHFVDKLTSHIWSNMISQPQHAEEMSNWLLRFMQGGWQNVRDGDFEVIPPRHPDPNLSWAKPNYAKQGGTLQTLQIVVDHFSMAYDEECGAMTTEFNWAVISQPVDKHGEPDPAKPTERLINGGFINHGTWEEPRWSSHT